MPHKEIATQNISTLKEVGIIIPFKSHSYFCQKLLKLTRKMIHMPSKIQMFLHSVVT